MDIVVFFWFRFSTKELLSFLTPSLTLPLSIFHFRSSLFLLLSFSPLPLLVALIQFFSIFLIQFSFILVPSFSFLIFLSITYVFVFTFVWYNLNFYQLMNLMDRPYPTWLILVTFHHPLILRPDLHMPSFHRTYFKEMHMNNNLQAPSLQQAHLLHVAIKMPMLNLLRAKRPYLQTLTFPIKHIHPFLILHPLPLDHQAQP